MKITTILTAIFAVTGALLVPRISVNAPTPGPMSSRMIGHGLKSKNWSGYVASGGTYRSVSAHWVEPAATCSGGGQLAGFWVGLDGFGSRTVEQTGTSVGCNAGLPVYSAWMEIFPAQSTNIAQSVAPGDHFAGSVTYIGRSRYTLQLADSTKGWTATVHATVRGAARSSAEAIVEAPSSGSGLLPLADFGTVRFTSTIVDGSAIGALQPAKCAMVNHHGRSKDKVSSLSGGENWHATWAHK
jgi:hypothetical protein